MKIDVHNHFIPDTLIQMIRDNGHRLGAEIVLKDGKEYIAHKEGIVYPNFREFFDYDAMCADLDKMGLDMAVLSPSPSVYYYWADAATGLEVSRMLNDWAYEFTKAHPDRFCAMASVPMQDIGMALEELRRAHEQLGLNALATAPIIEGKNLDDEEFFPIYEYCEANGILLFLHPYYVKIREQFSRYYNANLIGNVLDTNVGINHLIMGGVFERFQGLKVLTSHGGGYFPYQLGRLRHGYAVRPEPHERISRSPEKFAGNLYFDSITHWTAALQFLVDQFGADHVVLGTDYPYDMGDYSPVEHLGELRISREEYEKIAHKNARELLKI